MKGLSLLLFAFLALPLSSMAQTVVTYGYDAAGNRTTRVSSVELAATNESPAMEESNTPEFDFVQVSVNKNNMLCNVFEHNMKDAHNDGFFENKYWWNRVQLILCSLESPLIVSQGINVTQKRI